MQLIPSSNFHTHYYTVVSISNTYKQMLVGFILHDAFSINKCETVLVFSKDNNYISIRFLIEARSGFMFVHGGKFERAGSVYLLFQGLLGNDIKDIIQHKNNRSFSFVFDKEKQLVFKFYGGLGNIIFFENNIPIEAFRTSIANDLKQTFFELTRHNLNTYDDDFVPHTFYVVKQNNNIQFVYNVQGEDILYESKNVFDALNYFGKNYLNQWHFKQKKDSVTNQITSEIKRLLVQKSNTHKTILQTQIQTKYDEIANVIMANIHLLHQGLTKVELHNFYTNDTIIIKLKKEFNPQQNAAEYYRKAKNKNIETDLLHKRIDDINIKLHNAEIELEKIQLATSLKELKGSNTALKNDKKTQQPFKNFSFDGFTILVGKNAENNDKLTLKFANKNDMWLHAKDVTGSHVIIRYRQGKTFNKALLEYAAQLAPYFSKSKSSALVPVVFTLKKFVRKPKGAKQGAVLIEKEEVILVQPKIQ